MRGSTEIYYLFESVGRPDHKQSGHKTLSLTIKLLATWLLAVPMGSKIRVILARDETELRDRRSAANADMMDELESLLEGEGEDGHS